MKKQKELRPSQRKAEEICREAGIYSHVYRMNFYLYDLQNPVPDGDCNDTATMLLGDAIAYLLEYFSTQYKIEKIDSTFLNNLYYSKKKKKTFNIITQTGARKFKLVLDLESIDHALWSKTENLLYKAESGKHWNTCPFSLL